MVFGKQRHERIKLILLTISFFFLIGGYTLVKELKDSIFVAIVGKDYLPLASQLTLLLMIPLVFLYSKLVDRLQRYQLIYASSLFFGLLGLLFTFFLGHPEIGIANTDQSPYRIFGWLVYFAFGLYSPFLISVFWAFANSISSPDEAKKDYALMISGSKIAGATTAFGAWTLLRWKDYSGNHLFTDVALHQILLVVASFLILVVPVAIFWLIKTVPAKYLHGYEAVYQVEKEKRKKGLEKTGMLAGLKMFFKYPYIFGIFGMIFFFEVINVVLNYQRISVAQAASADIGELSAALLLPMIWMHLVGFFIAFFGTRKLFLHLGERRCLMFIPISAGILIFVFMLISWFADVATINLALTVVYVIFRSINYTFSYPLRESLYIPTVKEMKFKSKSWIDAFGQKLAKSFGSSFNFLALHLGSPGSAIFFVVYTFFFGGIVGAWFVVARLLGKRFDWAIAHNEAIGADEKNQDEKNQLADNGVVG